MLLVDTALPLPDTHHDFATGDRYTVTGRSTVVLVLMPEEGATRDVLVELEKQKAELEGSIADLRALRETAVQEMGRLVE